MHRKLIALTTAAVAFGAVAAPLAGAADDTLKVTGAYLYRDHLAASKQDFVRVVFRTATPLPRRYDGSIQAGVSIDGVTHSLGSVKRGASCYTGATEIKGGSVATISGGKVVRAGAKIGRTFTVKISTRDGQSVTRKLKLRAERRGDDTGKPLGC
ncbi:MAG TPA: hypothetical protein VGJ70_20010 [Solirubrobacteraceae bacterium]